MKDELNTLDNLEIEPLTDDALESVAGGGSSDGRNCCSCSGCSNIDVADQPDTLARA